MNNTTPERKFNIWNTASFWLHLFMKHDTPFVVRLCLKEIIHCRQGSILGHVGQSWCYTTAHVMSYNKYNLSWMYCCCFPKILILLLIYLLLFFFFFAKYADFYIHSLRDLYFDIFSCRRVGAILECVRAPLASLYWTRWGEVSVLQSSWNYEQNKFAKCINWFNTRL